MLTEHPHQRPTGRRQFWLVHMGGESYDHSIYLRLVDMHIKDLAIGSRAVRGGRDGRRVHVRKISGRVTKETKKGDDVLYRSKLLYSKRSVWSQLCPLQ